MNMPQQKPGRSKQDYGTPPELLAAIKGRMKIEDFAIDLAATSSNRVTGHAYLHDLGDDALMLPWNISSTRGEWCWLNPPYGHIEPWVKKAAVEAYEGAQIAMLVPSSVGSSWWKHYVEPYARVVHLSPRLTFVGCAAPYPKDCSLLLYTPWGFTGTEHFNWLTYYNTKCLKETPHQ